MKYVLVHVSVTVRCFLEAEIDRNPVSGVGSSNSNWDRSSSPVHRLVCNRVHAVLSGAELCFNPRLMS